MVNTPVDINQVRQSAATGHFRSIALWLNYPLVPQSIYARVQTDQYSGYLQVLLEFERPPKKDVLIRFVCNRLCQLESKVIRGVALIGRLVGTDQPLWQQRVKLSQRKQRATVQQPSQDTAAAPVTTPSLAPEPAVTEQVVTPEVSDAQAETITATTYGGETLKTVPSYLIPRETNLQERRRRPNRSVAPFPLVQIRSTDIDSTQTSTQRRMNRRRLTPKDVIEHQFKYMRAIVVTGSAAAAFILGCVTEAVFSQRGQVAQKQSPSLPTFKEGGWRPLSDVETQEIAYRSAMRGPAVSAALEPVAVMSHEPSSSPENPTVTLVFGGEVPVGDVPLQTPDAVEEVLGELEAFREADVAMVGLGNSLASADTSLQENYFERSRPDAADALLKGGIDIVGLTSDQTMDFGSHGLTETIKTLDGVGIYRVGAGRNQQEARRPEVLEVKGQRIAYLNYAPDSDDAATLNRAGLNIQERDNIVADIAALREAVDWIVVNYRWYGDLAAEPNAQQVNLSRSAIDAGADLVVGYHAQQLQGAELYKSRPIVYALGDFIFEEEPLSDHDTAALRVSLRENQMKVEFLPVSVREARPKTASGETARAILKQIRQASNTLPSPLQFPAILEATPPTEPLLKPEKPVAPLKTLGELEPGPLSDSQNPLEGEFIQPESFPPDTFDGFAPGFESFESEILDSETFSNTSDGFTVEPEVSERNVAEPNPFEPRNLESESWSDGLAPAQTMNENGPLEESGLLEGNSPLDSFNTQPDSEPAFDNAVPYEIWESPAPINPNAAPKRDTNPNVIDNGTGMELIPQQEGDDILAPNDEPLPGYDMLENWGEKSSPHKEFNPIQERLNNFDPSEVDVPTASPDDVFPIGAPEVSVEPDDETEDIRDTSGAISPHDEPLVGPLG
ncbi:CapA family protein [Leptothoe sp. ISB3NOV94-8A]